MKFPSNWLPFLCFWIFHCEKNYIKIINKRKSVTKYFINRFVVAEKDLGLVFFFLLNYEY